MKHDFHGIFWKMFYTSMFFLYSLFPVVQASFYTTTQWETVPLIGKEYTLMNTTMPYIMQSQAPWNIPAMCYCSPWQRSKTNSECWLIFTIFNKVLDFFFFLTMSDFRFSLLPQSLCFKFFHILWNDQVNSFNLYQGYILPSTVSMVSSSM